ncbi:MAG: glycine cleavage system protein GcvH [Methylococcales bacterium]|nr:glycine cleavage system protein GcvH [Methylococcales bacterium]
MSNFPEHLKYAATTHEWVEVEDDALVRVGITDFAQQQLGDLVFVELPQLGRKVVAQEQCVVLESVKTASEAYSPVSGEIVAVNLALEDAPELVNDDPYGAWLFCVKADDLSELDSLLTADAYRQRVDG